MSGWILDNVDLPVVDVQDDFAAAVAKHGFPYRNAQKLEYLGTEERSIKLNCLFYRARYAEHKSLSRSLLSTGKEYHELNHPDFGILRGKISAINNSYDERKQYVAMAITFIVEDDGDDQAELFSIQASVKSNTQATFADGQETLETSFKDTLSADIGSEAGDLAETEIDDTQTLLAQFLTASTAARNYLSEIDDAIEICEGYLSTVSAPANSFLNTIDYGSTLPGRFVGVVNEALDRIHASEGDSTVSPRHFLENLKSAYFAFAARFENRTFNAADQVNDAIALRYALDVGTVYDDDNLQSLALVVIEESPGFDVAGNRIVTDSAPAIMTINDLEDTLYSVREMLQAAIDRDRSNEEPYKNLARQLLDHVEIVRLNRERIVIRNVSSEMPLHVVCKKFGLPAGYAERVLAINPEIRNPTFVKGDVRIYA